MVTLPCLNVDLHTHSTFSDGRSPVEAMANAAKANGMTGFALTDHVFDPQMADDLLAKYAAVDVSKFPVKCLLGCEVAVKDDSGLPNATPEQLSKFGLVLMDCNYVLFRRFNETTLSPESLRDALCDIVAKTAAAPGVQILAHAFNFGRAPFNLHLELFDNERIGAIAAICKKHHKIIEIMNQMYFWHANVSFEEFNREYLRILAVFRDCGLQFSAGSDTHSECGIGNFRWTETAIKALGVEKQMFLPECFLKM